MKSAKKDHFCDPYLHPQNWTVDLLFKNNIIRKHVANFKNPFTPFLVDFIKCMVPY